MKHKIDRPKCVTKEHIADLEYWLSEVENPKLVSICEEWITWLFLCFMTYWRDSSMMLAVLMNDLEKNILVVLKHDENDVLNFVWWNLLDEKNTSVKVVDELVPNSLVWVELEPWPYKVKTQNIEGYLVVILESYPELFSNQN